MPGAIGDPGLRYGPVSMPAVFVHGVPETHRIWDPLRSHLSRADHVALDLPGFGSIRPGGFEATKDAYVEWLVAELEGVGEPVDLVGHDWGGGLVLRVVSTRPDLVRTWASDFVACAAPDFAWHDFAKIWQTPGDGEAFWEQQLAAKDDWRGGLVAVGGPADAAAAVAGRGDATMTACILDLYRSAVDIATEWGAAVDGIEVPGMAVVATDDPFIEQGWTESVAERAGARTQELGGQGHWWMLTDPAMAAAILESFWAFG